MPVTITRIPLSGGFGKVSACLPRGEDGFVLVDTGSHGGRRTLEAGLDAAGCRPGDLKLLLITHADGDHIGNVVWVRDRFGAPIAMHEAEVPVADKTGDMFSSRNTPATALFRGVMKVLGLFFHTEAFTPDLIVEEGFDLTCYGVDAKVLRLAGHSNGSIGVLTADGDLVCGDLLMNQKHPGRHFIVDDRAGSDATIARLDALGIRTVYPGHGDPFAWSEFDVAESSPVP